jgi:hypothetical protein
VAATSLETISPEILASLPMITLGLLVSDITQAPYAEVNLTISIGVNPSPGFPPMVPLIPEIDLISDTIVS